MILADVFSSGSYRNLGGFPFDNKHLNNYSKITYQCLEDTRQFIKTSLQVYLMKKLIFILFSSFLFSGLHAMQQENAHQNSLVNLTLESAQKVIENNPRALLEACESGDYLATQIIIEAGAPVNVKDACGMTPLHWAATQGHARIAKLLIEKKANIHIKDNAGRTPLHRSASKGDMYITQLLIENGAEVHAQAASDMTPLHLAAQNGRVAIVQLLIAHGAQVNAQDENGKTPLHLLIARSADLNLIDDSRWTLLQQADEKNRVAVIKALLKGPLAVKRLSPFSLESLRNICVYKLFDDRVYDEESITDTIVPYLNDLNIEYEKQTINIKLCKEIVRSCAHNNNEEQCESNNNNSIPQQIDIYCKRYLSLIKEEINNENMLVARRIKKNEDLTSLLNAIDLAQSFDELPEDLQDIVYNPNLLK